VLRASVITTYTSRVACQHDTLTHKPYCPPPANPFTLVGASRPHTAGHLSPADSQHGASHQTCHICQVRQGMPTSCAPGSHLPGTRFMPACRPHKHACCKVVVSMATLHIQLYAGSTIVGSTRIISTTHRICFSGGRWGSYTRTGIVDRYQSTLHVRPTHHKAGITHTLYLTVL
jgi:hypothetical protein